MIEKDYYENPFLWNIERYLENKDELERLNKIIDIIPEDVLSLLDVGYGNGVFLHLLQSKRKGIYSVGLERSKIAVEVAYKNFNVKVIEGDVSSLPFKDREFDCITALEVIEHLPYGVYEKAINEFERVSKKYIIISVPYKDNLALTQCPYCGCKFNPNFHFRRFDERVIKSLFSNFKLVKFSLMVPKKEFYFYRLLKCFSHLVFGVNFPEYTVCPACGYRKIDSSDLVSKEINHIPRNRLKEFLTNLIPKRKSLSGL